MSHDRIRFMHALFLPGVEVADSAPWHPHLDVYRTPTGWLLKYELAGVRAEDIQLEALGGMLTLRGTRRDAVLEGACGSIIHHRMEISYHRFERVVQLPCDVKAAEIVTELRDGLLLVRITPQPQPNSSTEVDR
ncbi:MAG: Hsp20/alpha crystallin family protein [Gemmataceae bacterium]